MGEDERQKRQAVQKLLLPLVGVYATAMAFWCAAMLMRSETEMFGFGLIFAVSGAVAVLINPYYGVMLFVVAVFTRPGERNEALASMRIMLMLGVLTLGSWAAQYLVERRPRLVRHQQNWGIFWFIATIAWSTLPWGFMSWTWPVLNGLFRTCFSVWLMLGNLTRTQQRMRLCAWMLVGLSCYLGYTSVKAGPVAGDRVQSLGFTSDPNDLAAALLVLLPLCFALFSGERGFQRKCGLAACIVWILYGIYHSKSRGGWLGLAAVIYLEVLDRCRTRQLRVLWTVVFIFVGPLAVDAGFRMRGDESGGLFGSGDSDNARSRKASWRAGWNMCKDKPLTGVGTGKFVDHFNDYKPDWYPGVNKTAHSSLFLVMGEQGVPGTVTFLLLMYQTWMITVRVRRKILEHEVNRTFWYISRALRSCFVGWMVSGQFLSHAYAPWLYIVLGLILASEVIVDELAEEKAEKLGQAPPERPHRIV